MDASNGQAQTDSAMDVQILETGQVLAAAALSHKDASISNLVESKPRFECPHCNKSYTTKKSLQRHVSSADNACAKGRVPHEQVTARPSKPRWACSRCGKDCTTNHSVERHINRSCWRTCDECTADGFTRCDSVAETGPCRTCEGKGRSCTKHTSAIPGTKPVLWTGAAARPQLESTIEDEAAYNSDQQPAKRKAITTPETSPERTRKNKRPASADEQVVDHDVDRVYDPLGGQASISANVKIAAVSDWLDEQSNKSASVASTHTQLQNNSSWPGQAGLMQNHHFENDQPAEFIDSRYTSGGTPPSSAAFLTPQYGNGSSTPNHQEHLPFPPLSRNHCVMDYRPAASPGFANLPHPPSSGGLPSMTVGRPMQLNQMFFQMQTLRQQNRAHELDMARRFGPRTVTTLPPPPPPFGVGGPLKHGGDFSQAQGRRNMPCSQAATLGNLDPGDSVLTLRVHSNTHDKNGQPIFSMLRMRPYEAFGPRLDVYCANRGKEYGRDWMFVYRYQTETTYENPGQDMQITLTWDMAPANLKIIDRPGVTMRNMDTIYVMKAKTPATTGTKSEQIEGGAVQSPGPRLSHETVEIANGETKFFQNPDVTRQWYQAIEQDNARLRASHNQMKSVITQLKQELFAKNQANAELNVHIAELTNASKEYRESIQRRLGNPIAPGPGTPNTYLSLTQPRVNRIIRQRPEAPVQQLPPRRSFPQRTEQRIEQAKRRPAQQAAQQHSKANLNAFVTKCEAVRDPQDQAPQQLEPLTFPSFSSEFTFPDNTHQPNLNFSYDTQAQDHSRSYDAANKVVAEGGGEEMGEK